MRKRPSDVEKLDKINQSINLDGKGNLTVNKDLGVDGTLTLKSLISESNPDGDITKELGGGGGDGKLYCHCLDFQNPSSDKGGRIILNYYSKKKDAFKYDTFKNEFSGDKHVACNGFIEDGSKNFRTPFYIKIAPRGTHEDLFVLYFNPDKFIYDYSPLYLFTVIDSVSEVI